MHFCFLQTRCIALFVLLDVKVQRHLVIGLAVAVVFGLIGFNVWFLNNANLCFQRQLGYMRELDGRSSIACLKAG
jgi:hypothetical protein